MSISETKNRLPLNRINYSVRTSQAVLQYGVGAMVDFKDQTLMTAAPEYWYKSIKKIHDERLEKVLGVDYFGVPVSSSEGVGDGISYARFPEWYFCPKCRKFKPLRDWIKLYQRLGNKKWVENDPEMIKHLNCPTCKQNLVVSRLVTVCEHGHIDDFPWVKWVHAKNVFGTKSVCSQPSLEIHSSNSSSEGLEALTVNCKTCGAKATLKDAFTPDIFKRLSNDSEIPEDFKCRGRHPWKNAENGCDLYPQTKQRGSSAVYFPVSVSSLVIPPYSSVLNDKIEQHPEYEVCKNTIKTTVETLISLGLTEDALTQAKTNAINTSAEKIAFSIGESVERVKEILERKYITNEDEEINITSYKHEEYLALSGEIDIVNSNDADSFVRESVDIQEYKKTNLPGIDSIKSISLIKKIREVQALIGFSRLTPCEKYNFDKSASDFVSVKEPDTNWYPAYEVRGEGIFIELDGEKIEQWIDCNKEVVTRAKTLDNNYNASFYGQENPREITAKFLLLHTLSHLLIKELSFNCGYNIASIKERIYCSDEEGKKMSGIFIYTAGGDSEGTLGGLVRQGRSDLFPATLKKAIESARVCSNDPVCSLSNGQGRDSLNLAACYSCSLIPETSCEEFNVFLDRGVIIGTYEKPTLGFFTKKYEITPKDSPKAVEVKSKTTFKTLIIKEYFTDWSDEDYDSVWDNLDYLTENHEVIAELKRCSEFENKEKPIGPGFIIVDNKDEFEFQLAWPKSKVILFTEDEIEEYAAVRDTEWNAFIIGESSLNSGSLIEVLKEK